MIIGDPNWTWNVSEKADAFYCGMKEMGGCTIDFEASIMWSVFSFSMLSFELRRDHIKA